METAAKEGPYSTFEGSPISQGIFQFDMWGVTPSTRWDWQGLRERVMKHGVRNSLLLAPMPTASTAQILGRLGVGVRCGLFGWVGVGVMCDVVGLVLGPKRDRWGWVWVVWVLGCNRDQRRQA